MKKKDKVDKRKFNPNKSNPMMAVIRDSKSPLKKEIDIDTLELITDMPPSGQKLVLAILKNKDVLRKSKKKFCEEVGIKDAAYYRVVKHPKVQEFLLSMVKTPALLAAPVVADKLARRAMSKYKCVQSEKMVLQIAGALEESPKYINVAGNVIGSQNILANINQKEKQANEEIANLRANVIDAEAS